MEENKDLTPEAPEKLAGKAIKDAGEKISRQMESHISNLKTELANLKQQYNAAQETAKEASAQGDRSENADWQIAMDRMATLAIVIASHEDIIKRYDAFKKQKIVSGEKVQIGSTVKLSFSGAAEGELCVKIFPAGIGNAKLGAISASTPVGKALLGKAKGEVIVVKAPMGEITYEIKEVC